MSITEWKQPVTGLWSDAKNWTSGTAPGANSDIAILDLAPDLYTVAIANNAAADRLALDSPGATLLDLATLAIGAHLQITAGTLALGQGATLEGGTTTLGPGASFLSTGGTLANLTWRGPIDLAGSNESLAFGPGVTLEARNASPHTAIRLGGTLSLLCATTLHATLDFGGTGLAALSNAAPLTLAPDSIIHLRGNGYFGSGTLVSEGTIKDITASAAFVFLSPKFFLNLGTITLAQGAELRAAGNTDWTNAGHIAINHATLLFSAPNEFANLGTITLAAHAALDLLPIPGATGNASNDGAISLDTGAHLYLAAPLAGHGSLTLGQNTEATFLGGAPDQKIAFESTDATLNLADAATFHGLISGFGAGDVIDLLQAPATGLNYANNTLTLIDGSTTVAALHLPGPYHSSDFHLFSDRAGGTFIKIVT